MVGGPPGKRVNVCPSVVTVVSWVGDGRVSVCVSSMIATGARAVVS